MKERHSNVMKEHIDAEGKKPFQCTICDARFSDRSNMRRHIALIHEEKKKFRCENCGKSFSTKRNMTLHIASIHERKKP